MIIVLFHALYLLGKYVYENFHNKTEDKTPAVQLLNVTEADYRDSTQSEHIDDDEQNFVVKFFPPVYVQRYTTVLDVLASPQYHGKVKKVIDFGCAELSFAVLLKNAEGVEEIYCVDVDRQLLENFQSKVAPLHCDYLSLRTEPLSIHVCEGSIAHNDKKLENTDAVICIELIEHLYPDDLDAFPHNVFGFIKPQVAIVTTPNVEFNVLFKGMKGFRHADHKFEWTRAQFQDWANNIVLRYPDYEVSFHGIGSGPGGTEHLGSCSQMAVFHRHSVLHDEIPEGVDCLLKTVVSHKYPHRVDNRSDEEKILDEAVYYIRLYSARNEEYSEEIPLKNLMFSVEKYRISIEILKSILQEANWGIVEREDGPAVLVPARSVFSTYSGADFDDFLENDYRHRGDDDDWDTLEQGTTRSGYLFNTYMEENPRDNIEEEENWDEPTQDDTINSENFPNSELHVSETLDQTSDSQWTMEDSNNDDPMIDAEQQPDTTSHGFDPQTELPSDSLSIGLDPSDVDYLDVSIDSIDSSERDLSSTQSPGTALSHNSFPQQTGNENQASFNILETGNDGFNCILQNVAPSLSEEATSSRLEHVAIVDETDCNSVCNESSSVSTVEATCLLSQEQSFADEKDEESLGNDQSIDDNIREKRVTSLLSENDKYYDLLTVNTQPSCTSDNSLYAQNEMNESYKNLDISNDSIDSSYQKSEIQNLRSEGIKSQDSMSFKSMSDCSLDLKPKYTSSPQVCVNDDKIKRLLDEQNRKSTLALRSEPKTVQSRNIRDTDCGNRRDSVIKPITTAALESSEIKVEDNLVPRIKPQLQNDENLSSEGFEKIDENEESNNIEKVSPSTSQLSLQSNSDISLSTATSTGSSNVEKWYSAEANPMYRRDLVALKGGNDTADDPNEETSDSDVTSVSSTEPNKVKDHHTSKTSDRCSKPVRNNLPKDKLKEANAEDLGMSKKSSDLNTVKYCPDDLLRGKMNEKLLPCFLAWKNRTANLEDSHYQGATMKDISSIKKNSPNIVLDESIGTQGKPVHLSQDRVLENEGRIADNSSVPTSSSEANYCSFDQRDVYEVTKTLAESTRKLFEKVDVTRSALETSLKTTTKLTTLPLVNGPTESDVTPKTLKVVNVFTEQVQNTNRPRAFLLSDDIKHEVEPSCDPGPFGYTKQTGNDDFQALYVSGGIRTSKSITTIGASAPCNTSKIGGERSQLNYEIDVGRGFENVESNPFSPESLDTPPNSWSPEIMDSGYPNSASVHDTTPEYELSSIANDRISDSDSASIEDMPLPAVYEFLEVENGDLANNNRDDEGNNVIAFQENDLDDLQPLIDVLENDMENENDIYVLENGFPMWLLRILEMANPIDIEGIGGQHAQLYPALELQQAGGDAANVNADNDEGFDSSSSSEDESDVDDDEAEDDATTVSSDETDEQSAGNVRRDWRAGGDP